MSSDVVVLGAGVIGSSIACHLAWSGTTVTLVDRTGPARAPAATWASAGGLRAQGRHAAERVLAIHAAARWKTLEEELEADLEAAFGGHLHLAESEEQATAVRQRVAEDSAGGVAIDLVDAATIRKIAPGIAESSLVGAWTPGDGQAHPGRTAAAFVEAARRLGATVIFGEAGDLRRDGERVSGVVLGDGRILDAAIVVLATGAWSVAILDGLGLLLPLRWRGLQMLLSEVTRPVLRPTVTAVGRNLSLKQLPSGQMMVGGSWMTAPGETIAARPVEARVALQWNAAAGIFPPMAPLALAQTWAGVEAQTTDRLPFIGPSPLAGLYLATGFSNHGFQISPAVGELVARDILHGREPLLDPFRPGRAVDTPAAHIEAFRDEAVGA